jgi:vitamin B12 transporter
MSRLFSGSLSLLFAVVPLFVNGAELDAVIVTATRTALPQQETLAATQVFTRTQIESSQARSIQDLLRGTAGMTIANSGGSGKLSAFSMRGADADQLLVLVDGVKVGSATAGTAALQNLPLELVDRIEIVRGPRSSLYGSEAVGGVLQIFTRRASATPALDVSASTGSFDTRQAAAAIRGGGERVWFNLDGSMQKTRGFNACRGSSTFFAGCFTEEPDRDGERYRSVMASAGATIQPGTAVAASLLRAASNIEYDGTFANRSSILQQVLGLSLTQALPRNGKLALQVGRSRDVSDDYVDAVFQGDFRTRRDSVSVQLDLPLAALQVLTLGSDWSNDVVSGSTPYDESSRDDLGFFAQLVGRYGPLHVETSLRSDDNQQFGRHLTGGVAFGYSLSDALQWVAQYGTAFKAPTFNELYYPFFGNAALQPERARSMELAAKGRIEDASWRVSLFDTRVRDLIGFDSGFLPANIDRAHIQGLEAELTKAAGAWQFQSAVTWLASENLGNDFNRGNDLPRRPRYSGHLDLQRTHGKVTWGARMHAEGARYDDAANARRLDAYATVDLRAEIAWSSRLRLQAQVENILNHRYETVAFYNQAGRAAYLTVRHQFRR